MRVSGAVITIISGIISSIFMQGCSSSDGSSNNLVRLEFAQNAVERSLSTISNDIRVRLGAFAQTVAQDRLFALKLLAEQDRSSPDVTEFAQRFMKPMGFSTLDITDSSRTIISSGAFTANTGTDASARIAATSDSPVLIRDNVMGESKVTFQAKKAFQIADIPFCTVGGIIFDSDMLKSLSPFDGCTVFLRIGNEIIGSDTIRSVSEIKKNKMIVNDKEYYAASIPVPCDKSIGKSELVVIVSGK